MVARSVVAVVTAVVFTIGCTKTVTVPDHAVVVQIVDDPTRACITRCVRAPELDEYTRCLGTCPGSKTFAGTDCLPWAGDPSFYCAPVFKQQTTTRVWIGLVVVGGVLLVLAGVLLLQSSTKATYGAH